MESLRQRREHLHAQAAESLGELLDGDALTAEAMQALHEAMADESVRNLHEGGGRRSAVEGWSRKSRSNLLRTIAGLNLPGHWGMLTLTVPGIWWCTPGEFKAMRKALRRRWERQGWEWSALWKLEFQQRGAPHFHVGVRMPDGVEHATVAKWVAENWHEIVCHSATNRHRQCSGSCERLDHLAHGARLDSQYARRLRSAGSAFAGYFAKHGVWADKEYQHTRPGWRWRGFAGVLDLMAGAGAGDELRDLADQWDHPGRWWGYENVEAAPLVEGEMTADEVECARLLARKVVARRSWRWAEVEGRTVFLRRSLPSLHPHRFDDGRLRDPAGFWLLMANPSEFRHWFLSTVRELVQVPPGIERARWLATVEEPGARPRPGTQGADRSGGVRRQTHPTHRTAPIERAGAVT